MTDLVINFNDHDSKRKLWEALQGLTGEFCIKIKRKTHRRTNQVNKYYWGVVLDYISNTTGENPALLHGIMKEKFIPNVIFLDEYDLSTANLDNEQMWSFIEMIREWSASFLNCYIPEPNEVVF